MKIIPYLLRYSLIMILGYLIKYIGFRSVFELPYPIIILFIFVSITFGIIRPLEIKKDVKYKEIRIPLIILTSILCIILLYFSNIPISGIIIITIANIIMLIILKPKYEKIEEESKKYIEEYFNNNK